MKLMMLEVEVKFLLNDLAAVRQRVLAAGATLKKARVFERNVRFDTPDEALRQRFELLRLRQDTAVKVTFKGPSAAQLTSEAKVREEFEMTVSDYETAVAIFTRLGFQPLQIYEKYRETFQLDAVEIVLDELPYGHFIELEGEEAALKQVAQRLELSWQRRVLTNYLAIMGMLKERHQLPFEDVTFDQFAALSVSAVELFEAV